MSDLPSVGKWLLLTGLILAIFGGLIWVAGKVGLPFGRLPGDIRIERDGSSLYFPVASCLLLSLLFTIGLNMIVQLFSE